MSDEGKRAYGKTKENGLMESVSFFIFMFYEHVSMDVRPVLTMKKKSGMACQNLSPVLD